MSAGKAFMKKTTTHTTSKEKRNTAHARWLSAQIKKELECILGACKHTPASKSCVYWAKVVDSDDPALEQLKLIEKIIRRVI